MNNSRYALGDKQVNDISLKDLAKRSRYGGIFYLLAFWAAVFSSATAREHLDVIGVFSGCFLLLQSYRLVLFFKVFSSHEIDYPLYFSRYAFIYNSSAIVWVSGSAWLFYINPVVDLAVTINMMAAAGISIGGITVLAPSYKTMRSYWLLICWPFALAAGFFLNEPGNLIVVGLILGYGLFIFVTGKQQNRAYWQALNDNLKLSEQAEELEKARVEAERAGQVKADFLAAMTHEIRTPMNGVLGMAQLLSIGDLNEQQQQVTVINNAGRTLMHIINNILDYSKINAEQLELEKMSFSPRNVVNEVMLLLAPQFEKKPIKLTCTTSDIPELVQGDPYRLHQILYNLVGNAFKFTNEGEISIEVSCKKSDVENKLMLSFSVRDTGIGIAPDDQKQIFEQFYQVSHFNPNIRGTGLGLSITKRLVELMGGDISVESDVGVGSTFTIALPFALIPQVALQKFLPSLEKLGMKSDLQFGLHILLVEDNKINQMICEQFFLKLGCSVDCAETGVSALEKFNGSQHYDVIFMDCNMPEMDGFSATVAIRKMEKDKGLNQTPIIALTAHVEEDIKRKCLDSGMNAFISKPFLFEDLESVVNKVRAGEFS